MLAERSDKKIQPPEKGRHAYRLLHPVTIRVDGRDIHPETGALFTLPQDDIAAIAEGTPGLYKYHIALSAISVITFD